MHRRKIILVGFALFISGPAHAGDLGWAGALSGAGNAMGQSMQQMQNAIIQQELMRQQQAAELERMRVQQEYQLQREREQERSPTATPHLIVPQTIADERLRKWRENDPTAHDGALSQLFQRRSAWEAIMGRKGSKTPYRAWLAMQPATYQDLINESSDPYLIEDSIDRFKAQIR